MGAITKKLAEILQPKYNDRMQTGATIVAVVSGKEEVQVTYMLGGELKTVAAKAVIMATPKFITRRIVEGLPDKQSDAMHQIRYIPYPVVNLIFDKPVFNHGYDTWCPGNHFYRYHGRRLGDSEAAGLHSRNSTFSVATRR